MLKNCKNKQGILFDNGMPFYSLNQYCRDVFGEKVYRLSLDAGFTCPNRDGTLSHSGCLYCSEGGSGDFASDSSLSIHEQISTAKERITAKSNCTKFIAYFQAYTNTYGPVSRLRQIFTEAINQADIVALSIATRSDCLDDEIIDLLCELTQQKPFWIDLGLQSIHKVSLDRMNTHTSVEQFDDAVQKLHKCNISVIAHLILGLPGETKEMMLQSVDHVAHSNISGVKLQLLHILKNTPLADIYSREPFKTFELEEYCDFVIDCIERLPSDMVIHRMTGDGPRALLLAPLWSTDKKRVLNTINKKFKERNTWQGRMYSPKE